MTTIVITAVGVALLLISLAARHTDAPALVAWISGWGGSVLVIVGAGRVIFLP